MRISDWSSDVCSSDLSSLQLSKLKLHCSFSGMRGLGPNQTCAQVRRTSVRPNNSFKTNLLRYTKSMAERDCHGFGSTKQVERKSGEEGKRVSDRLDRGGY